MYREKTKTHKINVSKTRNEFYRSKINKKSSAHDKSREIWNVVNQQMGRGTKKNTFPKSIIVNGNIITDHKAIANNFAENFSSKLSQNIQTFFGGTHTNYTTDINRVNSFYYFPVSSDDVFLAINELKNRSSTGYDNIPTIVI